VISHPECRRVRARFWPVFVVQVPCFVAVLVSLPVSVQSGVPTSCKHSARSFVDVSVRWARVEAGGVGVTWLYPALSFRLLSQLEDNHRYALLVVVIQFI
jgi:hypothetical protein